MVDRVGQQLGNYRLLQLLGRGGFAEVYLGEHIHLKTQAAIKVLHTQITQQEHHDFLQEAHTIAHLEHRNIVRLLDYGIENSIPFLVMSYASHGTVRQRYPHGTILPLPIIVSYIRQVASALQYAHDEHIVHRDVKPENMLIGRHDDIQLSDFGIAVTAHSEQSLNTENIVGTPAYMAPEQFLGKPRPASDQYALAVVVYEWLCGERPFSQGDLGFQHNHMPPPHLHEKVPNISLAIEQVVMQALAKEPSQRFSSIQEFALMFEAACQAASPSSLITKPPHYVQSRIKRRIAFATVLLVVSLFLVGTQVSLFSSLLGFQPGSKRTTQSTTPGHNTVYTAMPPTQVACPPSEKAHSAIMIPLQVGQHPNIVFVSNKGTFDEAGQITKANLGSLKRYDVTTHQIIDILNLPETNLRDPQVSADGQWILFTSSSAEKNGQRQDKLQMIRIDGQGLQTLFCSTFSSATPGGPISEGWDDARWSPDQQSIALVQYNTTIGQTKETIYLLKTASGEVESQNIDPEELLSSRISSLVWNGNTALDLIGEGYEFEKVEVYNLLLGSASAYQMKHDVLNHITEKGGICHDFDRSSDQTELLSSSCISQFPTEGPGGVNIKQGPSTIGKIQSDGQQKIIYQNSVFAIQQIRIVNDSQLLFTVANLTGDTSQNGLWKINLDGSHLTHLFSTPGRQTHFESDHNLWTNISRDRKLFVVKVDSGVGLSTLVFGSIDGGEETVFATASPDIMDLSIVGWTSV